MFHKTYKMQPFQNLHDIPKELTQYTTNTTTSTTMITIL